MFTQKKNTDISVFFYLYVMDEKHIKIQNTVINYWEKGKSDIVILFLHGNSLSKNIFINQFNSKRFRDYRLIALDLPGNGGSDRFINSKDYIQNIIPYLIEFISNLEIDRLILCGHSLGGHICFRLANYIKEKLIGICTIGTPPLSPQDFNIETPFSVHPLANLLFDDNISEKKAQEWSNIAFKEDSEYDFIIKNITEADPNFRKGMREAFTSSEQVSEIELINNINKKILLIYGSSDFTLNTEYISKVVEKKVNKSKVVYYTNSGHFPHIEEHDLFNQTLVSYIQGVI